MGRRINDITGRTFGMLTVLPNPTRVVKHCKTFVLWDCRCTCGNVRKYRSSDLKRAAGQAVLSCGCAYSDYRRAANRQRNPSGRRITKEGYVSVRTAKGWQQEHRVVMEQKLGRPLMRDEEVHHKNTIRSDNAPDNLELWVKSKQPKGGRVADMVAWAKELLARYPEAA